MTRQYGVGKTFTTTPQFYARNYELGESLRVVPAELGHDTGTTPGVAIFSGSAHLFAVLTAEHAYNLANGLADALDAKTT